METGAARAAGRLGEVGPGVGVRPPLAAAPVGDILLWSAVLVALVLALGALLLFLRRRYHPTHGQGADAEAALSIDRLEALRRQGQITDEEFRRLRRAALGLDAPAARRENGASSGGEEDDDA